MSTLEYRVNDVTLEVRSDGGQDQGVITGYASSYARDTYGDRIEPGAFAQTIKDKRGKVPILFGHDDANWIGFSTTLAEDHKGLLMTAQLALATSSGRDAFELVKAANAADFTVGLSVGFITKQWDMEGENRLLKEIDLWEVSIVPFPANRMARIEESKSLIRTFEHRLRDVAGLSVQDSKRVVAMLTPPPNGQQPTPARDVRSLRQYRQLESLRAFRESLKRSK